VPEPTLEASLDSERATAIRTLLRHPLLDVGADRDGFRLVVRHRAWLEEWFDATCGWPLTVDVASGFARLRKRSATVDERRPLLRSRGSAAPFDRRRYQLLCLAAAELVRHPTTTVGLLASAIAPEAGLDTSRHGERAAFVDALRALRDWGALRASAGDVDAFVEDRRQNALLTADTSRLHRLLASATAPSTLPENAGCDAAIDALLAEPRYGAAAGSPGDAVDEQRLRWLRHTLARRVLDDPAVYVDGLSPAEADYLANPAGRRWLRERAAQAGMELEERAEGLVAVDPEGVATDRLFPAPQGNAHQLALLLVDHLLVVDPSDGARRPCTRTRGELRAIVDALLERFGSWARSHRADDGPDRLLDEAAAVLVDLDLATREPDGALRARPALARYRPGEPPRRVAEPELFGVDP
jgi:uncharacterized protein (TIGR02678 family)